MRNMDEMALPVVSSTTTLAINANRLARPEWARALRRYLAFTPGVIGACIFLLWILVAIFAPLISSWNPTAVSSDLLQPPSAEHILGTDAVGRDVFAQIAYGARVSLTVAVITGFGTMIIGSIVGIIAGYFGGRTDAVLMRTSEVFQVIPSFALALVIAATLGANIVFICVALVMALWPQMARLVRGEVLKLMSSDMVLAAKTVGHSHRKVMVTDIFPNALPPLVVQLTIDIGAAILLQAALAFLGLGDPANLSWGDILQQAQSHLRSWWLSVPAGLAIFSVVLSANFMGDGITQALRPTSGNL